jgi:hypothetical protein
MTQAVKLRIILRQPQHVSNFASFATISWPSTKRMQGLTMPNESILHLLKFKIVTTNNLVHHFTDIIHLLQTLQSIAKEGSTQFDPVMCFLLEGHLLHIKFPDI